MTHLTYESGEDIQAGDRIRYHGEQGIVDFVVTHASGDERLDWFLQEYPGGGVMIVAAGFGNVFLGVDDLGDFLEYVSRGTA